LRFTSNHLSSHICRIHYVFKKPDDQEKFARGDLQKSKAGKQEKGTRFTPEYAQQKITDSKLLSCLLTDMLSESPVHFRVREFIHRKPGLFTRYTRTIAQAIWDKPLGFAHISTNSQALLVLLDNDLLGKIESAVTITGVFVFS